MKVRDLYIFYSDEDVGTELRSKLNILPEGAGVGMYEAGGASFETQLTEIKWSEVGIGRYTVLYYVEIYEVEDDDGSPVESSNINHAHIIVRHNTKLDIQKEDPKKVIEALTILDEADTI